MIKIPDNWMPNCPVHAVVLHWTGGARTFSSLDKKHYHFAIDGKLKLHHGVCSIADNVNLKDGSYAAHTRSFNARNGKAVIGVALCGMAGATQSPFNPGGHPITREQWEALADVVAQLARRYNIPCDDKHILQHGEVQTNLGIMQRGKWDICRLPWAPHLSSTAVCEGFRTRVWERMKASITVSGPAPKPAATEPPQLVLNGKLAGPVLLKDGKLWVQARAVLEASDHKITGVSDSIATTNRFYINTE